MGICNLKYINSEIKKRQAVHEKYMELLDGIEGLVLPQIQKDVTSNYAYFPVLFNSDVLRCDRNVIYDRLKEKGIYARKYFYPLISDADCYKNIYSSKETPVAKKVSDTILTLPIYADLAMEDVVRICKELREILGVYN
jgi:dTDP-4-amino-4,6-dideoxygalactose transaminase